MNVFYEEQGDFKVGAILTDQDSALQIESPHGKRSKIKAANVLLRFKEPALGDFLGQAEQLAGTIELDFLWEVCGSEEFGFAEIAQEYFGHTPSALEAAGMALRLHGAPMYFYRKGKGRYKAAPADALKAALASAEKKRLQQAQMDGWVAELRAGQLPEAFRPELAQLLHKPDKNSLCWKALDQACTALSTSPLRLLERVGGIPSAHEFHLSAFLLEYFPKGTGFPTLPTPEAPADLPLASVVAFSIDDSSTTEIDDAFSVTPLPDGGSRIGIHIAAPALGIAPLSPIDDIAQQRLSTVYFPGNKITMLPDHAIEPFSLLEGHTVPALSMYLDLDPAGQIVANRTQVERVPIHSNLRHETLDPWFNEETVRQDPGHDYPFKQELLLLHRLADTLEAARGKPEARGPKVDYSFVVEEDRVDIIARRRGSPMDRVVSELMIYVNTEWGRQLGEAGIPALYRAQSNGKTRMTTSPSPHQGLGVAQYAWSSSPLRRMVDLVNQRQILAMVQQSAPPYPPKGEALPAILRAFELTYAAYAEFQDRMERYWCLRYMEQQGWEQITATVLREGLLRVDGLPLYIKSASVQDHPGGSQVRMQLTGVDYLTLHADLKYLGTVAASDAAPREPAPPEAAPEETATP